MNKVFVYLIKTMFEFAFQIEFLVLFEQKYVSDQRLYFT